MNILSGKYFPLTLYSAQSIPEGEFQKAKTELQAVALNPKCGFGKALPSPIRGEVHKAKVAIAHLGKTLQSKKTDAETFKKEIVAKALSFNKTVEKDGQTSLLPIGLMALCRLKNSIPKGVLHAAKKMATEQTMNALQQEYMKHQVLTLEKEKAAAEKAAAAKTAAVAAEPVASKQPSAQELSGAIAATDHAEETDAPKAEKTEAPVLKEEETAPPAVAAQEETGGVAQAMSADGKEPLAPAVSPEKIATVEVKEPEAEKTEKAKRPKKAKSEDSSPKLSFWQKFVNFFKMIFNWIASLFTGKKKEENQ